MRRQVYGEEMGYLREEDLIDGNDRVGEHLCIYYDDPPGKGGPEMIAAAHIVDAEACDFAQHTGLPPESLRQGFYFTRGIVTAAYRQRGVFSLLLYLAMRRYRLRGRRIIYAYVTPGDPPARKILRYTPIERLSPRRVVGRDGSSYEVVATWQDIAYGMHRTFAAMPPAMQAYLRDSGLLADEVEQTVLKRLDQFYSNAWFERVRAGKLTREQYVATLANMHQFVRFTTRILGKVVGMTEDPELRRHYVEHLRGEVNHELLLENDLDCLGADVDYVVNHMVPLSEIQGFMVTQESMAAFYGDPVIFLAVPFTVEALSGHLPKEFGVALMRCLDGFGLADPRRASTFLSSHVHTDGGDDGHWEHSREMIRKLLTTETQVQRFLNVIHLVMNAQDLAYAAYAAIPEFSWTAADREEEASVGVIPAA
jgi:hypothetical protein